MIVARRITILFITLIVLTYCNIRPAYANKIDSLKTQAEVLKFLEEALKENGLISTYKCVGVSTTKWLGIYFPIPYDTIEVEDPVTREFVAIPIPPDTSHIRQRNHYLNPLRIGIMHIIEEMGTHNWQFHKADIDGNGYTDLLLNIDNEGVFTVMDMVDRFEGHIPADSKDFYSYTFSAFLPLPDGSNALLLRRNPCTLERRSFKNKAITYVTKSTNNGLLDDTVCKIITVVDSIYLKRADTMYYSHSWVNSDTVDIERYRKTDTIVYKYGGMAKYNGTANQAAITKISYYFNESCMEIQKDGLCFLRYSHYDTIFTAILDKTALKDLWNFVTYLDISSGKYKECGLHDNFGSGGAFVIHFDNNTKRELPFGVEYPPMGLGYLSLKLSEAGADLDWVPFEKSAGHHSPCPKPDTSKWKYTVDCSCRSIDMVECY